MLSCRVGKASVFPRKKQDLRHCGVPEVLHYGVMFNFLRYCGLDPQSHSLHVIKKVAFTLAEVLITLGIIGIVAAMTLPAVISNYRKTTVEVKLKRFYSVFNSALKRSEVDNGAMENWEWPTPMYQDGNGNLIKNSITDYNWFERYLKPYLNNKTVAESFHLWCVWYDGFAVKFTDGTAVSCGSPSAVFGGSFACMFFPEAKMIDNVRDYTSEAANLIPGKDYFLFVINHNIHAKNGLQPFPSDSCVATKGTKYLPSPGCAKKIVENNWEIPDDYPIKF